MRRTARIMLGVGSGLAVLAALTSCASTPSAPAPSAAASPPATTAAAAATPSTDPGVVPVTKVKFIISGYAPSDPACGGGCGPEIMYGSDSDTHDVQPPEINGTLAYTVPFSPDAEYYSVTVSTTTGSSHVSCKIIAVGPSPDVPLTVSSASATGQNECDAQAAPEDSTGETWQKEG